ncbi:MAG: rhomboid family intramembrane serine protease [Rhodobacter sp.]|nr:rhomboid family intramembrane serine protease [Rhodobacter sp.]
MFPIRDHNPSDKTPFVTYALIATNIVVFLGYWPLFTDDRRLAQFFFEWAMIPENISVGRNLYSLLTSMFLHAGFWHLAGNMLFLWIFGDNLEEDLGHVGFLIFYLASGVGAGLVHVLAAPWSAVPTVGASGAIAGVMGAYLLLYPKARVDVLLIFIVFFKIFPVPAWVMLGIWFGLQLLNGFGTPTEGGGVAYWAHIGGFVIGFLWVIPLWLKRGGRGYWQRTDGHPNHPPAEYVLNKSRVPTIRRIK